MFVRFDDIFKKMKNTTLIVKISVGTLGSIQKHKVRDTCDLLLFHKIFTASLIKYII